MILTSGHAQGRTGYDLRWKRTLRDESRSYGDTRLGLSADLRPCVDVGLTETLVFDGLALIYQVVDQRLAGTVDLEDLSLALRPLNHSYRCFACRHDSLPALISRLARFATTYTAFGRICLASRESQPGP